jgi:hypothetical protein
MQVNSSKNSLNGEAKIAGSTAIHVTTPIMATNSALNSNKIVNTSNQSSIIVNLNKKNAGNMGPTQNNKSKNDENDYDDDLAMEDSADVIFFS